MAAVASAPRPRIGRAGDPFFVATPPHRPDQTSVGGAASPLRADHLNPFVEGFPAALALPELDEQAARRPFKLASRPGACSAKQLAAFEAITGLSDVFALDSPVADWLLYAPHPDDDEPGASLAKYGIEQSFVGQIDVSAKLLAPFPSVSNETPTSPGPLLPASNSPGKLPSAVLCIPDHSVPSRNCIVGTYYRVLPSSSAGVSPFSRFAVHLPTGSSYCVTAMPQARVALDRMVYGPGRQTTFETMMFDPDGKLEGSLFGESICQFCFGQAAVATGLSKGVAYPGCHCPKSFQEREMGPRTFRPFANWADIKKYHKRTRTYAVGAYAPNRAPRKDRPWMVASQTITCKVGGADPLVQKLRLSLIEYLSIKTIKLSRLLSPATKNAPLRDTSRTLKRLLEPNAIQRAKSKISRVSSDDSQATDKTSLAFILDAETSDRPATLSARKPPRRPSTSASAALKECPHCNAKFTTGYNTRRHIQAAHAKERLSCPHCPATFSQTSNLTRHIRKSHARAAVEQVTAERTEPAMRHECQLCDATFEQRSNLARHCAAAHKVSIGTLRNPAQSGMSVGQ